MRCFAFDTASNSAGFQIAVEVLVRAKVNQFEAVVRRIIDIRQQYQLVDHPKLVGPNACQITGFRLPDRGVLHDLHYSVAEFCLLIGMQPLDRLLEAFALNDTRTNVRGRFQPKLSWKMVPISS